MSRTLNDVLTVQHLSLIVKQKLEYVAGIPIAKNSIPGINICIHLLLCMELGHNIYCMSYNLKERLESYEENYTITFCTLVQTLILLQIPHLAPTQTEDSNRCFYVLRYV